MSPKHFCISNRNRLLDQTTKQPLSNFEPKNIENISNFDGWALTLITYKKLYTESCFTKTKVVIIWSRLTGMKLSRFVGIAAVLQILHKLYPAITCEKFYPGEAGFLICTAGIPLRPDEIFPCNRLIFQGGMKK